MRGAAACLLVMVIVGGCSKADELRATCEANVRQTLINPETAEFYDFRPLTDSDFQRSVASSFGSEYEKAGDMAEDITGSTLANIRKTAELVGADLHIVRTRAEGRLGNRITNDFICMAGSPSNCQCFPVQ